MEGIMTGLNLERTFAALTMKPVPLQLNELIRKSIAMRRAALWRMRTKRIDHANFSVQIGRLEQWMIGHPHPSRTSIRLFLQDHYADLVHVTPGNKAGQAILNQLNQILDEAREHDRQPGQGVRVA